MLTAHTLPFRNRGRLFNSVVGTSLLHATTTWPMSADALDIHRRNDHAMPSDVLSINNLHDKLGLCGIALAIRVRRL